MTPQLITSRRARTRLLAAVLFLCSCAPALRADDLFLGERFRVSATYSTAAGSGPAQGLPLSADSGTFWFFSPANIELVVKVVDACAPPFERFWFFAAGLTNVQVEITVEDLISGETKRYTNPAGRPFQPIQDTAAFATCGVQRECGQGTPAELAATPRADYGLESLALVLSNGITARQATYDRLVADLAAIKAAHPELAAAEFYPDDLASTMTLSLTPEAAAAARAGTYHEWDCLNQWYDVEEVRVLNPLNVAFLRFRGLLRTDRLIAEYEALPGVVLAEQNDILPPPLPVGRLDNLCAHVEGARFHYLFDVDGGYWYFTSDLPGAQPEFQDFYGVFPTLPPPPPDWFLLFEDCQAQSLPL